MTTISPAALPAMNLDLTYGARDATPCHACRAMLPEVTEDRPIYELEETESGSPLCRPCARRVRPGLAAAVAYLDTLARTLHAAPEQGRESLEAVLNGVEMFYQHNDIPIPTVEPQVTRKPRTAPSRGRRGKRR